MADADIASNPVEDAELSSPTFEQAYEKASTLQSKAVEEKEVNTQDSQVDQETDMGTQENESTDFDELDPEKLPPELKSHYESLKASFERKMKDVDKGFTQGRQKDREELNQLKKEIQELKQARETNTPQKQESPEEYIDRIVRSKVTEQKLESFRDQALKDYNELDPRLNKTQEGEENGQYDGLMDATVGAQLDQLLEQHIEETGSELGFDYKSHGKRLVAEWDQYIKKQVDGFLSKQREVAKKQERVFQKTNPKASTSSTKPSGSMTLEQAIEAAFRKTSA